MYKNTLKHITNIDFGREIWIKFYLKDYFLVWFEFRFKWSLSTGGKQWKQVVGFHSKVTATKKLQWWEGETNSGLWLPPLAQGAALYRFDCTLYIEKPKYHKLKFNNRRTANPIFDYLTKNTVEILHTTLIFPRPYGTRKSVSTRKIPVCIPDRWNNRIRSIYRCASSS